MDKSTSFSKNHVLQCKGKIIALNKPIVMGILNLTPDSFYDGGKYKSGQDAVSQAGKMLEEGASIIDIGAASTRPGAEEIDESREKERLESVIKSLLDSYPDIIISVDTYRSGAAEWAIKLGCHIINDISGGTFDEEIFHVAAKQNVPYIMMHIRGTPADMQKNPVYDDVVKDIYNFFEKQINKLKVLNHQQIVIDPGFGFGKTLEHNYTLLKNLKTFKKIGYPVMAGLSRKSMINKVLGTTPQTALNGTTVLNTLALLNGADILRVHDVKEAMQVVNLLDKYNETEMSNL